MGSAFGLATIASACWVVCACFGCSGTDGDSAGEHHGHPTGALCPTGAAPTYDTFGHSFMSAYCVRCHATDRVGSARLGAPNGLDFDELASVRRAAPHIDEHAAAGPAAVNVLMPMDEPAPSIAERYTLGEWLACGAP